jgi:chloramphenicol-sensitive protein RarD
VKPGEDATRGMLFAVAAYGLWGFAPAYWKLLQAAPAGELLAQRVVWSLVVAALLIGITRRWRELAAALRSRRQLLPIIASSLLISVNWLIFLEAVNTGRVLATALGYFLNPLVNVLLGVVFLGERLTRGQALAVGIGAVGVTVWAVDLGEAPWIALSLAGSFALYGLVRKVASVTPLVGFALETILLAPACFGYLAWLGAQDALALAREGPAVKALVAGAGVITAAPLLCFTSAAQRLPLSTLGFFQYLAPSISFLLAVLFYDEPFGRTQAVAFSCVWAALALFSLSSRPR